MQDFPSYAPDQAYESLKVPPHSLQAEQSVLGGLLLDNETWDTVSDRVVETDFYHKDHRLIFRAISELAAKQKPFDVVTLSEVLEKAGTLQEVGGLAYLSMLAKDTPSAANIGAYADIVRERSVLRQLIHVGTDISDSAFNPEGRETAELLESAEQRVFQIAEQRARGQGGFIPIKTLLAKAVDKIEMLFEQEGSITGAATGFTDFDEMTSGLQPSDLIIVAGRPSMGKCLGKGTLVLMYSGELRKVEDLQIGDVLMGDDSTPRRILSLARGREAMYWIRQNKGIDYRVNESHILALKRSRNEGGHTHGEPLEIAVREYLKQSEKFKNDCKGYKVAVDFPAQELPVEAYFLGLWLGDGNSLDVRIATQDEEVVDYLRDYAERLGLQCNEHIPHIFLANSREQRLQLLAGLIDSDGHYDEQCGGYEITQKSAALAKQIKFLCDTLGFRTSLIPKQAADKTLPLPPGEGRGEGIQKVISDSFAQDSVFCVRFFGDVDQIPLRVLRKQAKPWTCGRSWNQTGITVEYDGEDDYYGFEIDGNGLFLLEDMTVTHNTTFAMNMAENIAMQGDKPVAVFSMEMPGDALALRMLSSLGRIDQHRMRTGKLEDDEWPRLTSAMLMLAEKKMFIDDTPALTPGEVRSRARRLMREHGQLGLIVLDYLQLMQSPASGDNRVQQISDISRGLKALAKELNVPVIALSQLNRNLEQRPNKRPVMSDLRESGSIEQDADLIIFIYRDEVYNSESTEKGTAEIIIGKQRNGPIGTVRLTFLGQYTRFENCAFNPYVDEEY